MNWYKKSQLVMQELGWDKFTQYYGVPWKHVLVMNIGDPTFEEKQKIQELKLHNDIITPDNISLLKDRFEAI